MADGRYKDLVKLYRRAQTTYSSSILGQVTPGVIVGALSSQPFMIRLGNVKGRG